MWTCLGARQVSNPADRTNLSQIHFSYLLTYLGQKSSNRTYDLMPLHWVCNLAQPRRGTIINSSLTSLVLRRLSWVSETIIFIVNGGTLVWAELFETWLTLILGYMYTVPAHRNHNYVAMTVKPGLVLIVLYPVPGIQLVNSFVIERREIKWGKNKARWTAPSFFPGLFRIALPVLSCSCLLTECLVLLC